MRKQKPGTLTILSFLGLAGVAPDENLKAQEAGRIFTWPMLILAFWLIIQWVLEGKQIIPAELAEFLSWIVWVAFVIETAVLTYLVDDKVRYLRTNWMNLFIIVSAVPAFWGKTPMTAILRALRIIVIPRLIIHWWRH